MWSMAQVPTALVALQGPSKREEEQKDIQTVQAHVDEDQTESRLTNAEKEGMERSEERGQGGRLIGGRGTKCKGVGWGREGNGGGGEQGGEDWCAK